MFPAVGFFKNINCPEGFQCQRPYCHFSHSINSRKKIIKENFPKEGILRPVHESTEIVKSNTTSEIPVCQSLPHNQYENTLDPESISNVDHSALLKEVISEAVKKVITENPFLSRSLNASDLISNVDTTSIFKNAVKKISKDDYVKPYNEMTKKQPKLYLPPVGIPRYNPTPISELKQKREGSTSVIQHEYMPTSCNKGKLYTNKVTYSPDSEAEFSPAEDDEQSKADFDILEQVLAERSTPHSLKALNNKKQKLKNERSNILKKSSNKARTSSKEDSGENIEDSFLPPSPVFKCAADIPTYSSNTLVHMPENSPTSEMKSTEENRISVTKPTNSDAVPVKNLHSTHSMLPQIANLSRPLVKNRIPTLKVPPTKPLEFSAVEELLQKFDGKNESELDICKKEKLSPVIATPIDIPVDNESQSDPSASFDLKDKSPLHKKRKYESSSEESVDNIRKKRKSKHKSHSRRRKRSRDVELDGSYSSSESSDYNKKKKHKKHSKHKKSSRSRKRKSRKKKHRRSSRSRKSSSSEAKSNADEICEVLPLPVALSDIKVEKDINLKPAEIIPVLTRAIKKEKTSNDSLFENISQQTKPIVHILSKSSLPSSSPKSLDCTEQFIKSEKLSFFDIVELSIKKEKSVCSQLPAVNTTVPSELKSNVQLTVQKESVSESKLSTCNDKTEKILPANKLPLRNDGIHNLPVCIENISNKEKLNSPDLNKLKSSDKQEINSKSRRSHSSRSHHHSTSTKRSHSKSDHHSKSVSSNHGQSSVVKQTHSSSKLKTHSHSSTSTLRKSSHSSGTSHNISSKKETISSNKSSHSSSKHSSSSHKSHHSSSNKHISAIKNTNETYLKNAAKGNLKLTGDTSNDKTSSSKITLSQDFADLLNSGDTVCNEHVTKKRRISHKSNDLKNNSSRRSSIDKISPKPINEFENSPEIGSPLPDLSVLDEINKEDWDIMLAESNGKGSEYNVNCSDEDLDFFDHSESLLIGNPDSTFDSDVANDPEVMKECFDLFSSYNPLSNAKQKANPKLPAKKAEESKNPTEIPVRHQRNARTGATGNLLSSKLSLTKPKMRTPAEIMLERYQKLKFEEATVQKKLAAHRTQLERRIGKCSPKIVSSSYVSSSSLSSPSSLLASTSSTPGVGSSSDQYGVSSTAGYSGKKRIARAPANVAALMNSKTKLLESRRQSTESTGSTSSRKETIAITNPKGTKRMAHIPTENETLERPIVMSNGRSKVPQNIRQRYLNTFIEETKKFCGTTQLAYDIAVAEENACHDRASNRMVYLNLAVNTVKKLRNQQLSESAQEIMDRTDSYDVYDSPPKGQRDAVMQKKTFSHPVNPNHKTMTHFSIMASGGQKGSWSIESNKKNTYVNLDNMIKGLNFYKYLKKYIMSQEDLVENGYPQPDPNEKGKAIIKKVNFRKKINPSAKERICARCSTSYKVDEYGVPLLLQACVYHWGRPYKMRGPTGFETKYSCCQSDNSADGCCLGDIHVSDNYDPDCLRGFVRTFTKENSQPDVFALDCEMCYTSEGNELTRITVINSKSETVYESLVLPDNPIIDYNTRFSGITAEDMQNVRVSLRDVQAVLLTKFSTKTILMGHSLESDFLALKLMHNRVVDTSIVFPHKLGPPYKRALRNLASELLRKLIQNDVGGHDSAEDAITCIQLMQWKVKEDLKLVGIQK